MRRLLLCLFLPLILSACADHIWASDEAVARAHYVSHEPPSLTLFTVQRKIGNEGAHSALMINGSERVLYDPAGSWENPAAPERNDLHYGITPQIKQFFISYHARTTYNAYEQTIPVSAAVAELAMQRAIVAGASGQALCANHVSEILSGLPGFESIGRTFFPNRLMREFAKLPGVVTVLHEEANPDDNKAILDAQKHAVAP